MSLLPPDFREFLQLLNSKQVEYLLIGGYAVGYHGYARATADIDIWIAMELRNAEKLTQALREFGFDSCEVLGNLQRLFSEGPVDWKARS